MKEIKPKCCAVCGDEFIPSKTTQKVCGLSCAIISGKSNIQRQNVKAHLKEKKAWNKEKKVIKEKIMSHSEWLKRLEEVFNRWVRESQKGNSCISCPCSTPSDAGHYRSRGAHPELRFNEFNVNLQCRKCNGYWGGNLIEYRKGLIKKYGVEVVEWLEGPHEAVKLSIPEIKEKIEYYRGKIKDMKRETVEK